MGWGETNRQSSRILKDGKGLIIITIIYAARFPTPSHTRGPIIRTFRRIRAQLKTIGGILKDLLLAVGAQFPPLITYRLPRTAAMTRMRTSPRVGV